MGKAYDGIKAELGKLGVGISSAELKAMSFTDVQTKLSDLFGGAASKNAETYQGRMDRLKVAFDESVEAIGYKLLPILQDLIDIILNKIVPGFEKFAKLFDPIKDAIDRNKESFQALGSFIVDYIVPVFTVALGGAISFVAKIAAGVVDIVGGVINIIRTLVSGAIDGINALIKAYNAIPILPNIPTISKPSFTQPSVSAPKVTTPSYTTPTISGSTGGTTSTTTGTGAVSNAANSAATASNAIGSFNAGSFRMAEAATSGSTINLTVNGAIDPISTARQIADILNTEATLSGTFSNLGSSRLLAV